MPSPVSHPATDGGPMAVDDASVTLAVMTPAIMAESLGIRMTEREGCQVKVLLHIVDSNANTTATI